MDNKKNINKPKLIFSIASVVFYLVGVIGLFLPFISKTIKYKGGVEGGGNNGILVGLNFEAFPQNLPNFLVVLFTIAGAVTAVVFLIINIVKASKGEKEKKEEKEFNNARMLVSLIVFGVCFAFLTFLFCSFTLYSYGIAGDLEEVGGYYLDYGAPVTAVGALFGGICLYYVASGLLD